MAIEKDEVIKDIFTEEEILEVMSLWKREPSYEFLLPDWHAIVYAGRWVNRGRFKNSHPEDKSMDYIQMRKNFHLYNLDQLEKLYRNKWEFDWGINNARTFYIVKIKIPLNNRKECIIYKPGICANRVLGGRYVKNNGNRIQSIIEVRNIHWHVAACLEEKAQYYLQPRPWLTLLYSHELIDSDVHGFFNDFSYDKDIEMFEERYRFCKNEIWNFNRKILKELQKANKKMEKSFGANNELRKELRKEANLRIKEIKKIRQRLRREYFKKIPKPKYSDKVWDYLNGGETEFRIWNDSEEKLLDWVELLLSFEKEKLDKYKNKPQVIFQKSI